MGRFLRGLSVIEVIVALSILSIVSLAIIATLTRLLVAQSSSSHHTVGRLLAESALQDAILAGPPDWGVGGVSTINKREVLIGQSEQPTEFSQQLTADRVTDLNEAGNPIFASPGPDMGRLWEVQVKVWWNSGDEARGAVERGIQSLTVSRVVYIET